MDQVTQEEAYRRALQRIANVPLDAPAERVRRIAVAALGGNPSTVQEAEVFKTTTSAPVMNLSLRKILKVYMRHFLEEEGTLHLLGDTPTEVRSLYAGVYSVGMSLAELTDGELQVLMQVRDEVMSDYRIASGEVMGAVR